MNFDDWIRKNHRTGVDYDLPIADLMEQAFDAGVAEGKERAADHVRGIGLIRDEEGEAADDIAREIEAL